MSLERRSLLALWVGSGICLSLGGLSVVRAETMERIGVLAPAWTLIVTVAVCCLATLLIRSHGWSLPWLPAVLLPLPWLPLPVPAAFLLWLGPLASLTWAVLAASAVTRVSPPLFDALSGANSGPPPRSRGLHDAIELFAHSFVHRGARVGAGRRAGGRHLSARGVAIVCFPPAGDECSHLPCQRVWIGLDDLSETTDVGGAEAIPCATIRDRSRLRDRPACDRGVDVSDVVGRLERAGAVPAAGPAGCTRRRDFGPSALDSANGDRRRLGVWIEVR
jgi:hypothetical protein